MFAIQIPRHIIDILPQLSGSSIKVLLFIYSETWGKGLEMTALSVNDIREGTGLSRNAVRDAAKDCEGQGLLSIFKDETDPSNIITRYRPVQFWGGQP